MAGSARGWLIATGLAIGVVALVDAGPERGRAGAAAERLAAEQTVQARSCRVRAVADDIEVKLRDERTDPEIAKDAVHALRAHTNVPTQIT